MRLDGVDAVAIGADWRLAIAARDGLSVNAGVEGALNVGVALSASGRHMGLGDGRLGIIGRKDCMITVAISADGGFLGAILNGTTMHTVLIRQESLVADAV